MSVLRGCCNSPHSAFSGDRRRLPGAAVCRAQHRIRQATSRPELRAVAELCAQEFSGTGLSARLGTTGVLPHVLKFLEGAMTEQAVRELLKRFSELEDRKKAGEVRRFVQGSGAGVVACAKCAADFCGARPSYVAERPAPVGTAAAEPCKRY